jgi:hypothetical protein
MTEIGIQRTDARRQMTEKILGDKWKDLSVFSYLSSVFCLLFSVFCFLLSVLCLLKMVT